jgi:hypothetical protein
VDADGDYLRIAAQVRSTQELLQELKKASAANTVFSTRVFWLTVALVLVGILQALAAAWPYLVAKRDKPSNQAGIEATSFGRYQMVATPTRTLRLDTTSGQTLFLDAGSNWKPLASAEYPENKARIVAELVADSLIGAKMYNPISG